MTGHVFVIQGDIRRFACDAYLHATDRDLRPDGGWTQSAPDAANRIDPAQLDSFNTEQRFTTVLMDRPGVPNEPATVLTAVPYHGVKSPSGFVPRLREFFSVAAEVAKRRGVTRALSKRERPLLAVPLFGVGGGGANLIRGEVFRMLYDEAVSATHEYEVDVAIVLRDPRDHALAQVIRRQMDGAWPELTPVQREHAKRLGAIAASARLVPFMGAGISISAGAPSWNALLQILSAEAGIDPSLAEGLQKYDALDQAAYVRHEFERNHRETRDDEQQHFAAAVIRAVDVKRYGIAPPLLAALEAEQAITLNYDRLFEWAAADGGRPRRVIPGGSENDDRWLLKLHGTVDDPASIVLTRDDYLGFNADRAALSSLVKATLMTRHLLFVGFGVSDPHFHEVVHDVRRAVPDRTKFGTVLTTYTRDRVRERLWGRDLDFIHLDTPRLLDIFLDALLAYGASAHSYLLADGFGSALSDEDRQLSNALRKALGSIPEHARKGAAWTATASMMRELGWGTESSPRKPALPKELL